MPGVTAGLDGVAVRAGFGGGAAAPEAAATSPGDTNPAAPRKDAARRAAMPGVTDRLRGAAAVSSLALRAVAAASSTADGFGADGFEGAVRVPIAAAIPSATARTVVRFGGGDAIPSPTVRLQRSRTTGPLQLQRSGGPAASSPADSFGDGFEGAVAGLDGVAVRAGAVGVVALLCAGAAVGAAALRAGGGRLSAVP